jgi:hypothetical protein
VALKGNKIDDGLEENGLGGTLGALTRKGWTFKDVYLYRTGPKIPRLARTIFVQRAQAGTNRGVQRVTRGRDHGWPGRRCRWAGQKVERYLRLPRVQYLETNQSDPHRAR